MRHFNTNITQSASCHFIIPLYSRTYIHTKSIGSVKVTVGETVNRSGSDGLGRTLHSGEEPRFHFGGSVVKSCSSLCLSFFLFLKPETDTCVFREAEKHNQETNRTNRGLNEV